MKTARVQVDLAVTRCLPSIQRGIRATAATRLAIFAGIACSVSCAHLGPKSIAVDRFDYSTEIANSWKQQTLLNVVKMRYMDLPVFVDVASVVAGYSMQTGVSVGGTLSSDRAVQGDFVSGSGQAVYTDRPTITYVPMTGEKFLRGLITPIDPKNIFFMLQAGYAADFILGLTVESLNGVNNRSIAGGVAREADPEFLKAVMLMREVQAAGAVGLRVEENKDKNTTGVVFFRREDVAPDIVEKSAEIRRLLHLPPDLKSFTLTYSPGRGAEGELAVNSRSMLQIMGALAAHIDVPEEHLKDHSAIPSFDSDSTKTGQPRLRIYSGKEKPTNTFAAVQYLDYWFWIDNGDWLTKRAFTAVMFFFTLADTGTNERLPLITIPAQ